VNATDELAADNARKLASRFFLRIGQAGRAAAPRDPYTMPLFGLPLIMAAEGMLAREARHLVDDEAEYLNRCEALIESAAREWAA
jgi:hypothetical protein